MGSAGLTGWHDEARSKGPGVVVGRSGASFGKVHLCRDDYWPLNTALFATDFLGNEPRFVYYALKSINFAAFNSGSAQPSLNRNFIASIPIAIPSVDEQKCIVSVLGALDDKIDSNRRLAALLEEAVATLFRARFVDFVGMEEFEESEIGNLPRGWDVRQLTASMEFLSGGTPDTSINAYWDGEVPWISIKDTVPGPYIIKTEKSVTKRALAETRLELYPADTVVITARGTVGNVALMAEPMTLNQSCYAVRGREDVGQLYILFVLRNVVDTLRARAHGSVFATITRHTFGSIMVAHPPLAAVAAFEREVRPLFDLIRGLAQEIGTLVLIRDTLLPKLISGEIRVAA